MDKHPLFEREVTEVYISPDQVSSLKCVTNGQGRKTYSVVMANGSSSYGISEDCYNRLVRMLAGEGQDLPEPPEIEPCKPEWKW